MKTSRLFSWFSRLSYTQKFIAIGLMFAVSLAGFVPMGRDQLLRRDQYGVKELEGTLYLRPLQALLADLNRHQILALQAASDPDAAEQLAAQQAIINAELAELAELDEKYGESLQLDIEVKTIQDAWQMVLEAAEEQNPYKINANHFQINEYIRQTITQVGNTSFLILDTDLDTYYMMDSALLRLPDIQDSLNQMMVILYTAGIQGKLPEDEKSQLVALSSEISAGILPLRDNANISWDNDSTGRMQQLTALPLDEIEAKVFAFLNAVNAQILLPDQMNLTPELFASSEAAQDTVTAYYDAVSQALEYGINGRIQELTNRVTFAIVFALLVSSIALAIGFLLMRAISQPLGELAAAAGRLGAGERDVRVPVTGEDEVGRVGVAFNTMVSELEAAQKKQVAQLDQLTQLTRALEANATISRQLSTILDPDQLVVEVVEQLKQTFNYYHAHIYVLDEHNNMLVMVGGTGAAGREMLAANHKIALNTGLVGRAAAHKQVMHVPDVTEDANWLPNPLLPETKSEVAVPIMLGEEVMGVLDVQHDVVHGLTQNDISLLQAIADQVAVGLQNARAYVNAQVQARREAVINDINRRIQMATDVETVLKIAARELGKALDAERIDVQIGALSANNGRSTN